jgi:hypothetical protein
LPTSTLVAINIYPHRLSIFQTQSLFYFLPFSLMLVVGLMLLLPNELVTQIIIHSNKYDLVFHYLNIQNKICGTFWRICDSDELLVHVSLP